MCFIVQEVLGKGLNSEMAKCSDDTKLFKVINMKVGGRDCRRTSYRVTG